MTVKKPNDHVKMIRELLDHDGSSRRLTSWEIDFLEYIEPYAPMLLTAKQQKKLEEIWNAIFSQHCMEDHSLTH